MKIKKFMFIGLITVLISFNSFSASALTLTVGNSAADVGQTVHISVTVDDPSGISGAAFTLTYDSSLITLTDVQSTFFDFFENQWNAIIPVPDPLPPTSVEVESTTYTQPLLKNTGSSGTLISAARCEPADDSNSTLVEISFVLNEGASAGTYAVSITSSVIHNTDVGYDESGESIPILIGADSSKNVTDPLAFPVLLDPTDQSVGGTLVAGSVTFNIKAGTDTDGDGILDDGDNSGLIDKYCKDGITVNCDDNCTTISNPDQTDTDNDGEGNACDEDDDNDGMPDVWENTYEGLNPIVDDAEQDADNDRFSNLTEYQKGTNPTDSKSHPPRPMPWLMLLLDDASDSDGMNDDWEKANGLNPMVNDANDDADSDGLNNFLEYQNKTDPQKPDTDEDGMPDGWEVDSLLNPLTNDSNLDADEDELINLQEYENDTNPQKTDTENDGMADGWEVYYGLNPLADDSADDYDKDRYSNYEEFLMESDPTDRNDPRSSAMPWIPLLLL